jgi:hypothetical protein
MEMTINKAIQRALLLKKSFILPQTKWESEILRANQGDIKSTLSTAPTIIYDRRQALTTGNG